MVNMKLAIITGADGGMGTEITRAVATAGYKIIMACDRPEKAERVKDVYKRQVNMCVFRENTEDIYAGIEWEAGTPEAEKFYRFLHDEMGAVSYTHLDVYKRQDVGQNQMMSAR